jgi:hypothetical protein
VTLSELREILDETGFPVAYSHFSTPPSFPYICYLTTYSSNVFADDVVLHEIDNIQIELYTNKKDLVAEKKVKEVLNQYQLPYETTETYIETERIYQKIYEVSL